MNPRITYSTIRTRALEVAKYWAEYVRPTRFDDVFYLPGVRVHIVIEEHKTSQDTKPVWQDGDEGSD
jgi:hypothetical protein